MTVKRKKVPFQWAPFLICLVIAVAVVAWVFFHTGRLPAASEVSGLVTAAVALVAGVGSHFGLSKVALSHDAGVIEAKYAKLAPAADALETAIPGLQSQVREFGDSIDQRVHQAIAALPAPAGPDINAVAELVKAKILGELVSTGQTAAPAPETAAPAHSPAAAPVIPPAGAQPAG